MEVRAGVGVGVGVEVGVGVGVVWGELTAMAEVGGVTVGDLYNREMGRGGETIVPVVVRCRRGAVMPEGAAVAGAETGTEVGTGAGVGRGPDPHAQGGFLVDARWTPSCGADETCFNESEVPDELSPGTGQSVCPTDGEGVSVHVDKPAGIAAGG